VGFPSKVLISIPAGGSLFCSVIRIVRLRLSICAFNSASLIRKGVFHCFCGAPHAAGRLKCPAPNSFHKMPRTVHFPELGSFQIAYTL
jgi:hypothetical protein